MRSLRSFLLVVAVSLTANFLTSNDAYSLSDQPKGGDSNRSGKGTIGLICVDGASNAFSWLLANQDESGQDGFRGCMAELIGADSSKDTSKDKGLDVLKDALTETDKDHDLKSILAAYLAMWQTQAVVEKLIHKAMYIHPLRLR